MPEYLTPGVYVEEVSFRAPSIEGVGTSTTAFVGVTRSGPAIRLNSPAPKPELLTSFGDYQNIFGGYDNIGLYASSTATAPGAYVNYMAMAVKAFFDNGGSQLYVSRVFAPKDPTNANSGVASSPAGSVVATARFPGAGGNQTVTVKLKAARTQNVGSLPSGSLVASSPNTSSLANSIGATDTTITLSAPLPGAAPAAILVESEIMTVTNVDPTGTRLTVTRGSAPASHAAGVVVLGQVGFLFAATATTSAQLTITSAPVPTTTTPAPTTTASGATTPAPTTTPAPATASAPAGGVPPFLQIDAEKLWVTQVDSTGTLVTLSKAPTAAHAANAPIFAPVALFTNGAGTTFQSGTNPLPASSPTLYVLTMQVSAQTAGGSAAVFDGLGFDPAHPYYIGTVLSDPPPRHIDALENQIAFTTLPSSATGIFQAIFPSWAGPAANATQTYTLTGGDDGLQPLASNYDDALALLTSIEEIAIVGAPGSGIFGGSVSEDIINSVITHVSQQRAYRVAILETPPNQLASDNEGVRSAIDSSYAALYVPWIYTPNPLASAGSATPAEVVVPPTGFMAGIWARSDENNGVAKAPANEVILGASRLERDISFGEQGILNPLGINCLRYFPNRGFRVWGARTVSSDPEFMYLNVRRYLVYLEHSIDNSTQWAVFENNGPELWSQVKEAIDSFLYNEYVSGNLLGDSASQAYFVRCDRTTMTQNDLDNGRMICLIGVAVLKPAEFVIFRIGQITALAQS